MARIHKVRLISNDWTRNNAVIELAQITDIDWEVSIF